MNNTNNERMQFLDYAKGFGMIFIVWGHISYLQNPVFNWLSTFQIVIFYIISGMLFSIKKDKLNKPLAEHIKSRLY